MSCDSYRNADSDRLVFSNSEEICVETVFLYRVELKLVNYSEIFLAVAEVEVNDERCRSVSNSLEIFLCDSEKYVLYTSTIKVTWDETLLAELFDNRFVADLANLAVQFEMFHFLFCF